ncbi:MAG: ABC transporter permease [Acidimicrobiia bacterium]
MATYILRRVLYSIPVILIASFLLLWSVRQTFDPCAQFRTSQGGAASVARCRASLQLDDSIFTQYGHWLGDAVQGNLGQSQQTNAEVSTTITSAFWYTIQLIFWGILVSALLSILLGVYSAIRQYSIGDYTFTALAFIGLAMPPFWFGLIAIQFLSVELKDVLGTSQPVFGFVGLHSGDSTGFNMDYVRHLVLPVMTLTVQIIAEWSRFQRASMLDTMSADYIRTARAKGVPRRRVVVRHGLRNALIPLVTVMALDIGALFGGIVITEKIFSIPGMGRLFLTALLQGDVPVLEAWLVVTAIFIVLFNLLADVLYGVLDPRIRLS